MKKQRHTETEGKSTNIKSFFGPYAHRWPIEALPMGYAMACIEVVLQESPEALDIYLKILEGWGQPGWQQLAEEWGSSMSSAEKQELVNEGLKTFVSDMSGTFLGFANAMKTDSLKGLLKGFLMDDEKERTLTVKEEQEVSECWSVIERIMEFVYVGFNRKTAQTDKKYKVVPSWEPPWLLLGMIWRIQTDHTKTDPDDVGRRFKIANIDGKIIDMEEILTKQKGSRLHRRYFAKRKSIGMPLLHDQVIKKRAWLWYQCRVANSSIEAFIDREAEKGNLTRDLKNIQREIRGCDRAVGYQTRRKRNLTCN